jgi:hypothetical protein
MLVSARLWHAFEGGQVVAMQLGQARCAERQIRDGAVR